MFLHRFPFKMTRTYVVQVEKLLIEQNRLREQKKLQEDTLALREKQLQTFQRMLPNTQPNLKVK